MAAAESALNKLMAALPGPMRAQAAAMRERLHVDPTGWRGTGEDLSMLGVVQQAVADERKLTFDYTRADGQKGPRTVDPLGVVAKGLSWYLVARGANGLRTYKISRMETVTPLASKFERPAQFDLAQYWRESTTRFKQQRGHFVVTLRVAPGALKSLKMWCATTALADRDAVPELNAGPEGWEAVHSDFEDEEQARFVVLGLGSRVRVVGPADFEQGIRMEVWAVANGPTFKS
jgi:predicted DNA-binding transcriptional regulator YafY